MFNILVKTLLIFLLRNYHVFYYLLAGANEVEAQEFHLRNPEEFCYLNQVRDKAFKLRNSLE